MSYLTLRLPNGNTILPEHYTDGNALVSNYLNTIDNNIDSGVFFDKTIEQVYAFGDIHGDFDALHRLMTHVVKCISIDTDGSINWLLMNTYIVFCGDLIHNARKDKHVSDEVIVDDQNNEFLIFTFLKLCDYHARFYNSRVIFIMGNHELMEILEVADSNDPNSPTYRTDRRKFVSQTTLTPERDCSWNVHIYDTDDEIEIETEHKASVHKYRGSKWIQWYVRNTYICVIINNLVFSHGGVKFDHEITTNVKPLHRFINSPDYNAIVMNDILTQHLISYDADIHGFYVDDVLYYFLNTRELGDYHIDKRGKETAIEFTPRKCSEYNNTVRKFYENTLKIVFDDKRKLSSTSVKVIAGHNTQTEAKPECGYIYNIDFGLSRAFETSIQKAMNIIKGELIKFVQYSKEIYKDDKLYLRKLFKGQTTPQIIALVFNQIHIDDERLFRLLVHVIGQIYIVNIHNRLMKWDLLKTRKSNGVLFCKSNVGDLTSSESLDFDLCEWLHDITFVSLLDRSSNSILYYLKEPRNDEYGIALRRIERCVINVEPNYENVKRKTTRMLNTRIRTSADIV